MSQSDWHETLRNDPRTIEELVQCALTEPDEDRAWDAVAVLHFRSTREVFDAAMKLSTSSIARERELSADILGQFGCFELRPYPYFDATVERLVAMLPGEQDPGVLYAVGTGLGHRYDARGVEPLSKLKSHPDDDVRYAVVMGLAGQTDPLAIQTLIDLTHDDATKVRDWATFTLGTQCDLDTPAIREALWQRIDDSDDDTRCEAFAGRAQRHDDRIIPNLIAELRHQNICRLAIEAARDFASPKLLAVLRELDSDFKGDTEFGPLIQEAIASCTKSTPASGVTSQTQI
jgi:HEAT repeat protein